MKTMSIAFQVSALVLVSAAFGGVAQAATCLTKGTKVCLIGANNAVPLQHQNGSTAGTWPARSNAVIKATKNKCKLYEVQSDSGDYAWVRPQFVKAISACQEVPPLPPPPPAPSVDPQDPSTVNEQDPFNCKARGNGANAYQVCLRLEISKFANQGRNVGSYSEAREHMFQEVDVYTTSDGERVVDSVYSKDVFAVGEGIPDDGVNTEHSWPQSKLKAFPTYLQSKCDIYHLFPTETHINSIRGNTPFAECGAHNTERVSSSCGAGFEPPEQHKGMLARAMFYMSVTYDMPIDVAQEKVFRTWAKEHPVTDRERQRAQNILVVQGNRNPFIEHPEWIDLLSDF